LLFLKGGNEMNFALWLPVVFFLGLGAMGGVLGILAVFDRYVLEEDEQQAPRPELRRAA
jgi:hypothetical protein